MTPTERRENATLVRYRAVQREIIAALGMEGLRAWKAVHGADALVKVGRIGEVERMWAQDRGAGVGDG